MRLYPNVAYNYFITGDCGCNNSEVKLASTRDQIARIPKYGAGSKSNNSLGQFFSSTPVPCLYANIF